MSEEDVTRAIIRPMRRLYPPPRHLRADEDDLDAALPEYRRALGRFDGDVLERAGGVSSPGTRYGAGPRSGYSSRRPPRPTGKYTRRGPSSRGVEEATALTDAYVKRFMKTSQTAIRAGEGGYEPELKEDVREAAWVQAQMIARRSGDSGGQFAALLRLD